MTIACNISPIPNCSTEYRHYIKIMISLLVLGRTAISVQPYKSLNVAVQVDWQERHWKSSSINWVRLWQPEHFLFPHNNMMAHKPTFRGQRKDSNYLKYTLKNVLRAKRGCLDTARKDCGQSLPTKRKPDAGRSTTADIQQSISSYQTHKCRFHDSRCWPAQEIWSQLSVHECSVCVKGNFL